MPTACFDDQAIADGAQVLLRFRDTTYATITDEAGGDNNGVWNFPDAILNQDNVPLGICDSCGSAKHVTFPNSSDNYVGYGPYALGSALTFEVLVQNTADNSQAGIDIADSLLFPRSELQLFVFRGTDHQNFSGAEVNTYNGSTTRRYDLISPIEVPSGPCWVYAAVTIDLAVGQAILYQQGLPVFTQAIDSAFDPTWTPDEWQIFGFGDGQLAMAAIYPTALTAAQIAQHATYFCSLCGKLTELVWGWS